MTLEKSHLGARNTQKADRHQHPRDSDLVITKLDTIKVLHAQTVRCDQAVKSKNLVHLNGGHKSTTTLPDDMRY
jgi:hypothetical protein